MNDMNDDEEVRIYGTSGVHNKFFIFQTKFDYNLV